MKRTTLAKYMGILIAATTIFAPALPASAEDQQIAAESDAGMPGPQGMQGGQPPQKPDGQAPDMQNGQPPQKPDGQAPDMQNGQPPQMPSGQAPDMQNGQPPQMPDGQPPQMPEGGMPGGPGGMAQGVDSYDAAITYSEDTETSGESYSSTGTDENAILVDSGASVTIRDAVITRESEESNGGDTSSFYGVGAAVLTTDGTVTIEGGSISTNAGGGAGVFAYGSGTAYVNNATVTTEKGTSGGIHVAGGGTLYASNTTVETQGESSAAIRSDRGGGTMIVSGGSYTSNGVGSPAIYSTADITVQDADLTANGSEAICIEGLNSIRLFDCNLTGSMADIDQNDCTWNIILYQSMSGDSEIGNSTFDMQGGTLTAKNGGMFYTTNTESTFILTDVEIHNAEDSEFFLKCTGNANQRGWGQSGANGADCTFTAISQEMQGDIIWDSISTLNFYMTEGSSLTGSFINDESCAGNGGEGYAALTLSADSTWTVTADSRLSTLYSEGTIVDPDGKTVTIRSTDGTVFAEGDSEYTITVDSYEASADFSGAGAGASRENVMWTGSI